MTKPKCPPHEGAIRAFPEGPYLPRHVPPFPSEGMSEYTVSVAIMLRAWPLALTWLIATRTHLSSLWKATLAVPLVLIGVVLLLGWAIRIRSIMNAVNWHGRTALYCFLLMHPRAFDEYFIEHAIESGAYAQNLGPPPGLGFFRYALMVKADSPSKSDSPTLPPLTESGGTEKDPVTVGSTPAPTSYKRVARPSVREEIIDADRAGVFRRSRLSRILNNTSVVVFLLSPTMVFWVADSSDILRIGGRAWLLLLFPVLLVLEQGILVLMLLFEGRSNRSWWWATARNNGYGFVVLRFGGLLIAIVETAAIGYFVTSSLHPA